MGFYNVAQAHDIDHLYKSACFSEANWLRGTECLFYPCKDYERDLESDFHSQLGDPVTVNVVLEDYTKAELEKLNWIAESDELPFHAYVSNIIWPEFVKARRAYTSETGTFKDFFTSCFNDKSELITNQPWYVRVSKFAILEFPYVMEVAGTQKFRVLKVLGDQTNPFIWDCQIAPHRDQVDLIPDTPDRADPVTNYNKNAQVVGYAFTKQKNRNEKPEEKYPPDVFMPEGGDKPDKPAEPVPPEGDEPKPKPDNPDVFQPMEPEPPEGIEPPEEIGPEPPEPLEPEEPTPPDWEEPDAPIPPEEDEESDDEDSDRGDTDKNQEVQVEPMRLEDPTNPYLRMYGNASDKVKHK